MNMSTDNHPTFPNKEERTKCRNAKDEYWNCRESKEDSQCTKFREMFEKSCPPTWVKYFDRRREYLRFKTKMEKDGYEPIDNLKREKTS